MLSSWDLQTETLARAQILNINDILLVVWKRESTLVAEAEIHVVIKKRPQGNFGTIFFGENVTDISSQLYFSK